MQIVDDELVRLSEQVNDKTEILNLQIDRINLEFKELNLGIEAWVDLSDGTQFGYGKAFPSGWGLKIIFRGSPTPTGLKNASRQWRVEALQKMPELITEMKRVSRELLKVL